MAGLNGHHQAKVRKDALSCTEAKGYFQRRREKIKGASLLDVGLVARDKGQRLPGFQQPHGVKSKDSTLARSSLCICLPLQMVREQLLWQPGTRRTRQSSLPFTRVTRVYCGFRQASFFTFIIRQDSWTQADRAGHVIQHPLPWSGLKAPWHCCPQGAFKGH